MKPVDLSCGWCGRRLKQSARGRPAEYCSPAHRQRAYEVRRLGREFPDLPTEGIRAAIHARNVARAHKQREFEFAVNHLTKLALDPEAFGNSVSKPMTFREVHVRPAYETLRLLLAVLDRRLSPNRKPSATPQPLPFKTKNGFLK
jgi:hypothetical protein